MRLRLLNLLFAGTKPGVVGDRCSIHLGHRGAAGDAAAGSAAAKKSRHFTNAPYSDEAYDDEEPNPFGEAAHPLQHYATLLKSRGKAGREPVCRQENAKQ